MIDGNSTSLANYLFGENGKDAYLEDHGTLWLLHYHLVKSDYASAKETGTKAVKSEDYGRDSTQNIYTSESNYFKMVQDKNIGLFLIFLSKIKSMNKKDHERDQSTGIRSGREG